MEQHRAVRPGRRADDVLVPVPEAGEAAKMGQNILAARESLKRIKRFLLSLLIKQGKIKQTHYWDSVWGSWIRWRFFVVALEKAMNS